MIQENIFKAYDVRAIYGTELTDEAAYSIGRAFAQYLEASTIVIGRDHRESSPTLFREVARGIQDGGANVIDIGIVSTPMLYYASSHLDVDGAIMITASHNPKEYNGLKLCKKNAIALGLGNGLEKIKEIVLADDFQNALHVGSIETKNINEDYYAFIEQFADLGEAQFSVVSDTANAVGVYELEVFKRLSQNISLTTLYEELDGTFPNHEANPIKHETLTELQKKVRETGADFGIAFDGDADRIGFVDENGEIVSAGALYTILIPELLQQKPGATLLYDLRLTKAIPEIITELGGVAKQTPVGHTNVKRMMRELNARAGAEVSGHFFYEVTSQADSTALTVLMILNIMAKTGKKLSTLAAEHTPYHHGGETSFTVESTERILGELKERYTDGVLETLDGIKISFDHWWFSVRASNTEPVIRFVIEAESSELLDEKRSEVTHVIESLGATLHT